MEGFSITEVIEQAVQTEKLGAVFYDSAAKRFKDNDEVKKLFETLASKELQHERRFSELKEKVKDEEIEGWEVFSSYLRAIVESAFYLGKDKSLTTIDNLNTASDAVDHAMGFEKETLLYYLGIRDALKERKIIDEIIDEERSHIVWLGKIKQSLT